MAALPNVKCEEKVVVGWSNFYQETTGDGNVYRPCGEMYAGNIVLCPTHEAEMDERYPQGWVHVPGDLCKHGVYVGGMMEDRMCAKCEIGEPESEGETR